MTLSSDTLSEAQRPAAGPDPTRDAIVERPGRQFAELGYDRATIRGIAR